MSESTIKVSLELVDKAAQKALQDFITKADGADKSLGKLGKQAENAGKSAGDASSLILQLTGTITDDLGGRGSDALGGIANILSGPVLASLGAVAVAAGALKTVFDFTLLTEKNQQIVATFDNIASSSGLAADTIRNQLVTAARGLADTEDILQAASKGIIALDENAKLVPQTMELARKYTLAFGGSLVENFDRINDAFAKGSARGFQESLGVVVNADEAAKEYARTLGTTADKLTEKGRKQAIVNAALAEATAKFAGVEEATLKTTTAYERAKVAIGDLGEEIAGVVGKSGTFSNFLSGLAEVAERAGLTVKATLGDGSEKAAAQTQLLAKEVENLGKTLEIQRQNRAGAAIVEPLEALLAKKRAELDALQEAEAEAGRKRAARDFAAGRTTVEPEKADTSDHVKEAKPEKDKFAEELIREQESVEAQNRMRLEMLQAQKDAELITEQAFLEEKAILQAETFQRENEALAQSLADKKITEEEYKAAILQLENRHALEQAKLQADEVKREKALTKQKEQEEKLRAQNLSSSLSYISTLTQSSSKELFMIGKAAALANAYIDAQAAVMKALASAPPPFNFALAAAVGAAAAMNIGKIASSQPPAFEDGGIVPGNSFSGDRVTARVNSGEMILNRSQQKELFSLANGGGSSSPEVVGLLRALLAKDERITVNIGSKNVVDMLRSELAAGRSFA